MKFDVTFFKRHPYVTGATVILSGVIFYKIYTGGSSSSSTTMVASSGVDPLTAQTNSQLALQGQQISGQLQAMGIQAGTQVQLATLQQQSDAMQAALQYQIANLQAGVQTQHDQLSAAVDTAQIQAQLQMQQSTNATLVNQAQISAQAQIAAINAGIQQAAINAQQQIQTTNATTQASIANAQIQANAYMYGSAQQASAAKAASTNSMITTLGIGLLSFFCDVNIKAKIDCVSTSECLDAVRMIPLDKFQYVIGSEPRDNGDSVIHINTYAQSFYNALAVPDWRSRKQIDLVDMMGVILGAIKELDIKHGN